MKYYVSHQKKKKVTVTTQRKSRISTEAGATKLLQKDSYVVIYTSTQTTICNMSERKGPLKFNVLK